MVMPKYQLAEHRYGREEMLALFDKTVAAPEPLRSISGLYVEKIQLPLALIQMSEEETVSIYELVISATLPCTDGLSFCSGYGIVTLVTRAIPAA